MGFFITILFVMMIFIRPQEYIAEIKDWPILDFLAIFGFLAVAIEGNLDMRKITRSPIGMMMVVFWLWLGFTWVPQAYLEGVQWAMLNFGRVVFLFMLIILTCDNVRKIRVLLWTLVCMSLFLAVQAIVQMHTGFGLSGEEALARRVEGEEFVLQAKGVGIFNDPNDLAIHMVPMMAFLLPAFHKYLLSPTSFTGSILMVPLAVGIIYTRSRGGILGLASLSWYYLRRRLGTFMAVGAMVILGAALLALPRMDQIDSQEESAHSRLEHWAYGIECLKSSPIWGIGMGGFTEDYPQTAHNSFVLIFAEAGLVGAFLWVGMFYWAFKHLGMMKRLDRAPPWLEVLANALHAALTSWLVCAFFLSQTYKSLSYILLALVVSCLHQLDKLGIRTEQQWTSRDFMAISAITVGGVVAIHLGVKILW